MSSETTNAIDTIIAPITAPGRGAVSVLRLSGPRVREVTAALVLRASEVLENPSMLILSDIKDTSNETLLDSALVAYFKAPKSFTGEDVLEVNLHGSPFLQARFMENAQALGVRLARAGEFSERAFMNGQLDLTQAEAVADLVHAETESQAKLAREQLAGKLSGVISELGEPLRDVLAEVEANIDFPDEDIDPQSYSGWKDSLERTRERVERYRASYRVGKLYRDGARVVLAGLPNAGKSSLLNRLLGEERAIVTPIAGTTRDSIEERISLDGLFVRLWDTAGLNETSEDQVEQLGVKQSWIQAKNADLVLYVWDLSSAQPDEAEIFTRVQALGVPVLVVANKQDAVQSRPSSPFSGAETIFVSALEGTGIDELLEKVRSTLLGQSSADASVLITTERHRDALNKSAESIKRALSGTESKAPAELIAADLRSALGALDEIIGVTHSENILGRIFSKFCIGK